MLPAMNPLHATIEEFAAEGFTEIRGTDDRQKSRCDAGHSN
jgi:hypothetical protein